MNRQLFFFHLCTAVFFLGACSSSEESGLSKQDPITPQQTNEQVQPANPQQNLEPAVQDPPVTPRARSGGSRLTSRRDTVTASVTRSSKMPARSTRALVRPIDPAYTVQVGAFAKAANALSCQKLAKERFPGTFVYNSFDSGLRLYRVSLGKFASREGASALRREIMNHHPNEYSQAWVNYIAK